MVERILESFPVGVGFHPTDEQLVAHYLIPRLRDDHSHLKMKIPGTDSQVDIIPEIDVCTREPWELQARKHPVFSKFPKDEDESESFFFSPLHKKNAKGRRQFQRATKYGFWKHTGQDRIIKRQGTGEVIATKKTLVFHRRCGRSAARTPWFIYEYHADQRFVPEDKTNYVVCRFKIEAGTGILIDQSGGPVETMTFGASNIAPDITNFKPNPQEYAWLDGSPVSIDSVGHSCERAALHRSPVPTEAGTGILIDQSGGLVETMTLGASNIAPDITNLKPNPQEYARLDGSTVAIDSVGHSYERVTPNGYPKWEFAFDSDGYLYERLIRKN